jgi:hypothetical protein
MSIENLRDLIIVIFGISATLVALVMAILAFILYARISPVIKSIERTSGTVERIVSSMEEAVAGPIAQVIGFIQGIKNALGLVKKFTKREED